MVPLRILPDRALTQSLIFLPERAQRQVLFRRKLCRDDFASRPALIDTTRRLALWQHPHGGLLRDQIRSERSDLQCALDVGWNELNERAACARASVVDDHVRRAMIAVDISEQPLHLRLLLCVAGVSAGTRF